MSQQHPVFIQANKLVDENNALRIENQKLKVMLNQTCLALRSTQLTLTQTINSIDYASSNPRTLKREFSDLLEKQQSKCIQDLAVKTPEERVNYLHQFLVFLIKNNASAFQKLAYYDLYKQALDMLNKEPPSAPKTPPPGEEQPERAPPKKTFAEMKRIIASPPPETARSKEMINKVLVKIMGPKWCTVPTNTTGWRIAYDSNSKKDYWWHSTTKKTQWTTPDAIHDLVSKTPVHVPQKKRQCKRPLSDTQ